MFNLSVLELFYSNTVTFFAWLIVFFPLVLILWDGWAPVLGVALLIADVLIARQVARYALAAQVRRGISEPSIRFLTFGAVLILCLALHALLLVSLVKVPDWALL